VISDICVVFDVDDTVYLERDYVRSGFAAVGVWADRWLGTSQFAERCFAAHEAGKRGQIFDAVLSSYGLKITPELITTLVSIYRVHEPNIKACPDAARTIDWMSGKFPMAIITDGPAISQSRKVEALGLDRCMSPVILTELLGREFAKPNQRAFTEVERIVGALRYVYIADNPAKDFIAPREMGWTTIRIRRPEGLHWAVDGGDPDFEFANCDEIGRVVVSLSSK